MIILGIFSQGKRECLYVIGQRRFMKVKLDILTATIGGSTGGGGSVCEGTSAKACRGEAFDLSKDLLSTVYWKDFRKRRFSEE